VLQKTKQQSFENKKVLHDFDCLGVQNVIPGKNGECSVQTARFFVFPFTLLWRVKTDAFSSFFNDI